MPGFHCSKQKQPNGQINCQISCEMLKYAVKNLSPCAKCIHHCMSLGVGKALYIGVSHILRDKQISMWEWGIPAAISVTCLPKHHHCPKNVFSTNNEGTWLLQYEQHSKLASSMQKGIVQLLFLSTPFSSLGLKHRTRDILGGEGGDGYDLGPLPLRIGEVPKDWQILSMS